MQVSAGFGKFDWTSWLLRIVGVCIVVEDWKMR